MQKSKICVSCFHKCIREGLKSIDFSILFQPNPHQVFVNEWIKVMWLIKVSHKAIDDDWNTCYLKWRGFRHPSLYNKRKKYSPSQVWKFHTFLIFKGFLLECYLLLSLWKKFYSFCISRIKTRLDEKNDSKESIDNKGFLFIIWS